MVVTGQSCAVLGYILSARRQCAAEVVTTKPASGKDSLRCYALLDDWRGKMAAPEEPELSQAQTEKLLQFQVDSLSSTLTHLCLRPHLPIRYR